MAAYTSIDNPELYFQTKLYTGNNTDGNAITLDGDENLQPDFLWIKDRTNANSHRIYDSVRGVNAALISNSTAAEDQYADFGQLESFDSDGFTVGAGNTNGNGTNQASANHAAWCWKESATAGFDIVSYAGNGAEGRDISHSLSAVPHVMIVKNRTNAVKWAVYHHKNTAAPETDHLVLDTTAATSDDDSTWDDTAPTSSVFRVKGSTSVNGSSANYISYLFTAKQGYSKFGSFTGSANADGPFIHTGFRPAWILLKNAGATQGWNPYDNKRAGFNPNNYRLVANTNEAEYTSDILDILSNGFKIRSNGEWANGSGHTLIYMAFAEQPFVNSNGVPCNAR